PPLQVLVAHDETDLAMVHAVLDPDILPRYPRVHVVVPALRVVRLVVAPYQIPIDPADGHDSLRVGQRDVLAQVDRVGHLLVWLAVPELDPVDALPQRPFGLDTGGVRRAGGAGRDL